MFQTLEGGELMSPVFQRDVPSGTQSWAYVVQPIELPWFHVLLGFGIETRVLFAAHVRNWVHLPHSDKDDTLRLLDVRLVSPGWLNGTSSWVMETLLEVLEGVFEPSGEVGWIFVVDSGRQYAPPSLDGSTRELTRVKSLYRAPRPSELRSGIAGSLQ